MKKCSFLAVLILLFCLPSAQAHVPDYDLNGLMGLAIVETAEEQVSCATASPPIKVVPTEVAQRCEWMHGRYACELSEFYITEMCAGGLCDGAIVPKQGIVAPFGTAIPPEHDLKEHPLQRAAAGEQGTNKSEEAGVVILTGGEEQACLIDLIESAVIDSEEVSPTAHSLSGGGAVSNFNDMYTLLATDDPVSYQFVAVGADSFRVQRI